MFYSQQIQRVVKNSLIRNMLNSILSYFTLYHFVVCLLDELDLVD